MSPRMLRQIEVAPVLVVIVEEGVGRREGLLFPILFALGWGVLVVGAWGVAFMGAGRGQFQLLPTELPRPPLLMWWDYVGLYVVLGRVVRVAHQLSLRLQGLGGFQ